MTPRKRRPSSAGSSPPPSGAWAGAQEKTLAELKGEHRERLAALTARGMTRKLKTTRAWSIKESLRDLWRCRSQVAAEAQWRWWYGWAARARLKPVLEVARMIKRHPVLAVLHVLDGRRKVDPPSPKKRRRSQEPSC